MRSRDSQRQKVYDAENRAFRNRTASQGECLTVAECQEFLDKCCRSATLRRRYPRAAHTLVVKDGRGRVRACFDPWTQPQAIKLPKWARRRWILLHELAHALIWDGYDGERAYHGWEFAECYLYLVRVFLGRSFEEALKREFKASKVRYRARRTRAMTDEQREAARQRMLAMHEARKQEAA